MKIGKKKGKINALDVITMIVMFVGGINWGIVGIFDFDLVRLLVFRMDVLARIVYTLVGVSTVYWMVRSVQMSMKKLF